MLLFEIGRVKKHTYPLAKIMCVWSKDFGIKWRHQWCFAYKMFKIGFIEIYYFSVDQG